MKHKMLFENLYIKIFSSHKSLVVISNNAKATPASNESDSVLNISVQFTTEKCWKRRTTESEKHVCLDRKRKENLI